MTDFVSASAVDNGRSKRGRESDDSLLLNDRPVKVERINEPQTQPQTRKRRWADTTPSETAAPIVVSALSNDALLAERRARMQAKLIALQHNINSATTTTTTAAAASWRPLKLDNDGRAIDESGRVIVTAPTRDTNCAVGILADTVIADGSRCC